MTDDNSDHSTTRRSLLLSGVALAGLAALPLVPASLESLATVGSAFARRGADDGPNDDGNHKGRDDRGHHGGGDDDDDDDDDGDDHDVNDDRPGDDRGRHKNKGGNHGPNHS